MIIPIKKTVGFIRAALYFGFALLLASLSACSKDVSNDESNNSGSRFDSFWVIVTFSGNTSFNTKITSPSGFYISFDNVAGTFTTNTNPVMCQYRTNISTSTNINYYECLGASVEVGEYMITVAALGNSPTSVRVYVAEGIFQGDVSKELTSSSGDLINPGNLGGPYRFQIDSLGMLVI